MQHNKATLSQILGHTRPCMFSRVGNGDHPFKYEPCRSECDGYNTLCSAYVPSSVSCTIQESNKSVQHEIHIQSQQTKPLGSKPLSLEDGSRLVDKTADIPFYFGHKTLKSPIMPKPIILPENYRDWIRKCNDRGVI